MSITKIAERAGVSIATASRVVNNSRPVKPEIAERVRQAMSELRYTHHPARRRRTSYLHGNGAGGRRAPSLGSIAVVTLGQPHKAYFDLPVLGEILGEICHQAEAQGTGLMISEMPDPNVLSPVLSRHVVDGALVFATSDVDVNGSVLARHCPVVRVMGSSLAATTIDHVSIDNGAIGYLAGQHLANVCAESAAFITTSPTWDMAKLRAQGFASAMNVRGKRGMTFIVSDDPRIASVYGGDVFVGATLAAVMDELVRRKPDGLFVMRDVELASIYQALRERGIAPCEQIKIISCDNERVRLQMLHPQPLSIDINPAQIADEAMSRLAWRVMNPRVAPARILLPPRLLTPDSAAPAATANAVGARDEIESNRDERA